MNSCPEFFPGSENLVLPTLFQLPFGKCSGNHYNKLRYSANTGNRFSLTAEQHIQLEFVKFYFFLMVYYWWFML